MSTQKLRVNPPAPQGAPWRATPEWLRLLRGWPCYVLWMGLFIWRWQWLSLKMLPYVGDWAYREDRREARKS